MALRLLAAILLVTLASCLRWHGGTVQRWRSRLGAGLLEETESKTAQESGLQGVEGGGAKVSELVSAYFAQARAQGKLAVQPGPDMPAANAQILSKLRARGAELLEALPRLPSSREEAWKYTSLKTLFQHTYTAAQPASSEEEEAALSATLKAYIDRRCTASCLVFVDGRFSSKHSNLQSLTAAAAPGVTFCSFGQAPPALLQAELACLDGSRPDAKELSRNSFGSDTLTAVNEAHTTDGALLHVPAGVRVDVPLQVVCYSTGAGAGAGVGAQPVAAYPKLVVSVGKDAHVVLKQTFVGGSSLPAAPAAAVPGAGPEAEAAGNSVPGSAGCLVLGQTRVHVAEGGSLQHTYEQDLDLSARHIEVVASEVAGGGR